MRRLLVCELLAALLVSLGLLGENEPTVDYGASTDGRGFAVNGTLSYSSRGKVNVPGWSSPIATRTVPFQLRIQRDSINNDMVKQLAIQATAHDAGQREIHWLAVGLGWLITFLSLLLLWWLVLRWLGSTAQRYQAGAGEQTIAS